jgi:hypothetical protein
MTTDERRALAMAALGLGAVLLLVSSEYLWRWSREFPPSVVVECRLHESHGRHAAVTLASGRRLDLTFADVDADQQCPAQVEKRRGETGYRFEGRLREWTNASTMKAMAGVGLALICGGVVLTRLLGSAVKRRR